MAIVVVRKIGRHWEARCTRCPNYRDARFGQVRFWTWQQMLDWANRHASGHTPESPRWSRRPGCF